MDCPTNQFPFSCDQTRKKKNDCWLPLNSTEDKAISVDATVAAVLSELGGILRLKGEQRMESFSSFCGQHVFAQL